MSENLNVTLRIPPLWETINEIREKIASDDRIKKHGSDLLNAAMMVASELLENAVKYGFHNPDMQAVEFNLDITDTGIRIEVSNAIGPNHDLGKFKKIITDIMNSDNPGELYFKRVMEIVENPKGTGSCLGLYRIAYEGEFSLNYESSSQTLKIIATRKM